MANPVAPATMTRLQPGTWRPLPRSTSIAFAPSRGGAIRRPADQQQITDCSYVTTLLTQAEWDALVVFYRDTLRGGALVFDMADPDSGNTMTFAFAGPPQPQSNAENDEFRASILLERFDN